MGHAISPPTRGPRATYGAVPIFIPCASARASTSAGVRSSSAAAQPPLDRPPVHPNSPDPTDKRAQLVKATPNGNKVFAIARELLLETEAELAKTLGKRNLAELRKRLEQLGQAL